MIAHNNRFNVKGESMCKECNKQNILLRYYIQIHK